ncbi:MAG: hypothetical protein R3C56_04970 [Pirellulaceae bacterium]
MILRTAPNTTDEEELTWWRSQIEAAAHRLPDAHHTSCGRCRTGQPSAARYRALAGLGKYIEPQQAVEYTIATRQSGRPIGTFHRITGALSSMGLQINAADIHTQPGDIAWDRFIVEDQEFEGPPPQARIDAVCRKINSALDPNNTAAPSFPKKWNFGKSKGTPNLEIQPTQVRFDNSTSDSHTIITLFAYDRMGLLYAVSKVLFDMQLILHFAKISTHIDQVVDVFYVTDMTGKKIEESTRLYMIRQRLLQAARSSPS